jgi:hypothetical protein
MSTRRRVLLSLVAALGIARIGSARAQKLLAAPYELGPNRDQLFAALGLANVDLSGLLRDRRMRKQLADALSDTRSRQQELRAVPAGELRVTLSRWIAEDFRNGALIEVDGWQVARSEAMVLALLAHSRAR